MRANTWVTARMSGGNNTGPNCVQCLNFRKAERSDNSGANCVACADASGLHDHCAEGECLAPGIADGSIVVRDSKLGADSPLAVFTAQEWAEFTGQVAAGRMDRDGDDYTITDPRGTGAVLRYTADEWAAFADGCRKQEFSLIDAAV
jgi:hypothetical protein